MPSGSNTSLGSLVYELNNLPTFYVAEIETLNSNSEQCLSRKLRCSAVRDFLKVKMFTFPFAVNHNAKRNQLNPSLLRRKDNMGPIDHLIIRCRTKGDLSTAVQQALVHHDSEVTLPDKEARRNLNGELQYHAIRCRFKSGARIVAPNPSDEKEQKLYSRCLDTFICTRVNELSDRYNSTNPANKDWFLDNPSSIDPVLKTKGLAQYCSVLTHAEPVLKLYAKELHLNLHLALCLDSSVEVPNLLFEYMGNSVLGSISAGQLAFIKGVLIGLEVKYLDPEKSSDPNTDKPTSEAAPRTPNRFLPIRTPRKKNSIADFQSTRNFREPLSEIRNLAQPGMPLTREKLGGKYEKGTSQMFSTYRIQDIRSSADVSRFIPWRKETDGTVSKPEETKGKQVSVAAYFENIKKAKLKYPNLPLAQVRHNTWIPLEFLELPQGQVLRNTGHLTDFVKVATLNIAEQNEHQIESFAKVDKEENFHLTGQAQQPLPIFSRGPLKYVQPTKAPVHTPSKEPEAEPKSPEGVDNNSLKARLIFIPSLSANYADSDNFLRFVAHGLHQATNSEGSTIKFSKPETTLIEVEKPLLLNHHVDPGEANDVLIGIVDHYGRTKAAIDQIRAEIHRFADQDVGCIAICISKQDLESSFIKNVPTERKTYAEHPYFPQGLLRKINFMLGGTNYKSALESKPLGVISTEMRDIARDAGMAVSHADAVGSAMIFGAHVSHPGSVAGVSCPSVAALVGTRNNTIHYCGAARVQPTMRQTTQRRVNGRSKPGIKHIMQSRILGLRSMVQERLASSENVSPSVIFFRHGLDPRSEGEVIENEKADIKAAFKDFGFDRKNVKLTYIVVAHNNRIVRNDEFVSPSGFAVEKVDKPKYWYWIENNDLEIPTRLLKDLVKRLNQSNQLGAEVTIALPVHFAQKLARRVFDYFHYYAKDSASTIPQILERTYHSDRKDGYKVDREVKKLIEEGLFPTSEAYDPSEEDSEDLSEAEQQDGEENSADERDGENGDEQSSQDDPEKEESKDEDASEDDNEQNGDRRAEIIERAEIRSINSITQSPWHPSLSDKMFYL